MKFEISKSAFVAVSLFGMVANAHLAAWHEAMWCLNGNTGKEDLNSYDIVSPLYQLSFRDWWFHHVNRCDEFPPAAGKFVDLPAGGSFRIEIASNRAKTSLSYGGRDTSAWPDGETYPENYNEAGCITSPNMHAQNHGRAAGTAFAISYVSDIKQVTPENLVVFSVRHNTPWKREIYYDVPAAMPPCPAGGCICAWGWVPNGCGQPNMYHQAFRCRVTNSRSNTPVAAPQPPKWCENNPSACTKGAKQMVYWNQLEGNNIQVDGRDAAGDFKSPGYNMKLGFADGAQNDIFTGAASSGGASSSSSGGSSSSSSSSGSGSQGNTNTNTGSTSNNNTGGGSTGSGSSSGGSTSPSTGGTGSTGAESASPSGSSASSDTSTPSSASGSSSLTSTTTPRQSCQRTRRRRRQEEKLKRALGHHHHVMKRSF
ncbi:hypothetical protein MD484_g8377, partial [Candolleomyces efflorescens]